jgi:hypothetical protein
MLLSKIFNNKLNELQNYKKLYNYDFYPFYVSILIKIKVYKFINL